MEYGPTFRDFVCRLRSGDKDAVQELVRQFEPLIQATARRGVKDRRLLVACDPLDICQMVLAGFFSQARSGGFELTEPDQLARLLITMTRNVLASEARRQRRRRRDVRLLATEGQELLERVVDRSPSPLDLVVQHEQLDYVHAALSEEEWCIVQMHDQGMHWAEVAQRLGGSGGARRMQLARALERVGRRLRQADVLQ